MKLKTRSSVKKRVKVTGSGRYMMKKACKNHLLANKSKRQKKKNAKGMAVDVTHVKTIAKMLP